MARKSPVKKTGTNEPVKAPDAEADLLDSAQADAAPAADKEAEASAEPGEESNAAADTDATADTEQDDEDTAPEGDEPDIPAAPVAASGVGRFEIQDGDGCGELGAPGDIIHMSNTRAASFLDDGRLVRV